MNQLKMLRKILQNLVNATHTKFSIDIKSQCHMRPDLQKPGTIPQSKIFSIIHYKTIVKMRYFKKNLIKFSNGHIHSLPILKNWVPFYSLELKEFKNLFIPFVFLCFCSKRVFVCAQFKIANF